MQFSSLIIARQIPTTFAHAARTAVAAIASYLFAGLFHLPEPHWASISTMVVMQSTLGTTLPISMQRFAGTAIGASVGAVAAARFPANVWVFGIAVYLVGILCAVLRIERSAYRYANITLAIVMLVARSAAPWLIGVRRFFEVSLGILVGLMLSALWPEKKSDAPDLPEAN